LNKAGDLVESRVVDVPGPTMMHDFAITEHHVVWLDLPMVFDLELVGKGMAYQWDNGYGARLGVMSKATDDLLAGSSVSTDDLLAGSSVSTDDLLAGSSVSTGDVQWFDIDPCYVFHVGNAHEDNGKIVLDAVRYSRDRINAVWGRIGGSANPATETGGTTLHRWTLDPATGQVKEEQRDDRNVEFPSLNENRVGRPSQYLYTVTDNAIVKYDSVTGASQARELGKAPGEAEFVPARNARNEDDGWLMSIVTDHDAAGSELVIFNAADLDTVAQIQLPRRVPAGFHGNWLADS
jgi:carotenoid cleavage dioxygenase